MSTIRFLVDRDVNWDIVRSLREMEPSIEILCVGEPELPNNCIKDPELLELAWTSSKILVTRDKSTMPDHLRDRYAEGKQTHGVIILKEDWPIPRYVEDLLLIWSANTAEDWIDRTMYLPM